MQRSMRFASFACLGLLAACAGAHPDRAGDHSRGDAGGELGHGSAGTVDAGRAATIGNRKDAAATDQGGPTQLVLQDAGHDAGNHPASSDAGTDGGNHPAGNDAGTDAGDDAGACPQAAPADCLGFCGGSAMPDCLGICNGSAVADSCGVCNGGDAAKDCLFVCNGSAVTDSCGVCNGGDAAKDCLGVCNGSAVADSCGVCNGGNADKDCAGTCFGSAQLDCFGVCNGSAVCMAPTPGSIVVSEVMFNPTAIDDLTGEWFELHNTTDAYLDLEGCSIADDVAAAAVTIDRTVLLAPQGYATFARSASPGFTPSFVYGTSNPPNDIQLSNSGDRIVLTCSNVEIERFDYLAASYPAIPGASLSVTPLALDPTQHLLPANWCNGTTSYDGDFGTPGGANPTCVGAPSVAGALVISELMPNPATLTDATGEWLELYNPGPVAIDVAGCILKDDGTDSHTIAASLLVPPHGYTTFASGSSPGFTPSYTYPSGQFVLANTSDEAELQCAGTTIDRVAYTGGSNGWVIPVGASLSLDSRLLDATSNDTASAWCSGTLSYNGDLGTPGAANPMCH